MDAPTFRGDFPEFGNTTTYPDTMVNFWIGLATKMLTACAWQDLLNEGIELYVAHNLALQAKNVKTASKGGAPGGSTGALTAKAVDKVSASYDVSIAAMDGWGYFNLTSYGLQFSYLANMAGMGGYVAKGCGALVPALGNGGLWSNGDVV